MKKKTIKKTSNRWAKGQIKLLCCVEGAYPAKLHDYFIYVASGYQKGGLAIHLAKGRHADSVDENDSAWVVTHIKSGKQIVDIGLTRARALALADALLAIADWTKPFRDIRAACPDLLAQVRLRLALMGFDEVGEYSEVGGLGTC